MNSSTHPFISLQAIEKSYVLPGGQASHALRGLTLSIAAGERIAILGKSGSGKSTLLNLLAGLDRVSAGMVQIGGVNLGAMSEGALARWRAREVGVVFQFFQLLPTLSALENVVLAMELADHLAPRDRPAAAMAALARVDLAEHAAKLPSMLSGGQQQRVAIARAMVNNPPLLLADEPTGNLDSETAHDVELLFRELAASGRTLIVVTHDRELAAAADRVIELKDGRVHRDSRAAVSTVEVTSP